MNEISIIVGASVALVFAIILFLFYKKSEKFVSDPVNIVVSVTKANEHQLKYTNSINSAISRAKQYFGSDTTVSFNSNAMSKSSFIEYKRAGNTIIHDYIGQITFKRGNSSSTIPIYHNRKNTFWIDVMMKLERYGETQNI